jgi:hypothetical protein
MQFLLIILIAGIIFLIWAIVEAKMFKVVKIEFKSNKMKDEQKHKIVLISDLHYGRYYGKTRLKKIVDKINSLKPELIIIGGDYMDNTKTSRLKIELLKELFAGLSRLKASKGVLSVLGNHEYYLKNDMEKVVESIAKSNIRLLRDETHSIRLGKDTLLIHGVEHFEKGNLDLSKLKLDSNKVNVVVSHNPDFFEEYKINFDLGLSGHTHGGQLNFFGLYAPVTESKYGQKYTKRINKKGEAVVLTSKGLGCSILPIRFFSTPDIIQLTISN